MARASKRFALVLSVLLGLVLASGFGAWSATLTSRMPQVNPLEETLDDRLVRLAEQIPGFGGLFLDENGQIAVYLVKGELTTLSVREIGAAIARVLDWEEPRLHAGAMRILPGQYDFRQLKEWHDQLSPKIFELEGVTLTDIDEARNRVRIGVEDEAAADAVIETLISLGIPREAILVEEVAPILPMTTLRDKVRPLVGGLQINFPGYLCTLGFNAVRSGVAGFVTNSHCTSVQGGVENTPYWQPLEATDTFIGTEIADPLYTRRLSCPSGRLCRYSDSAFAQFAVGVTASLGYLARTESLDSLTITGSFQITAEATRRISGEVLNKVGRTTGWSQGPITQTCVNVSVTGTRIVLLCQDFVQATVAPGDSGSPVFKITNNGSVTLYGLLWGGNSSGTSFVYSPIGNIQRSDELGPLTTCANGSC
ncbi:MAG: S1 family peptidase [Blastocatellia bacterium]|nr:S1 family peptidase [Blastocatellia bacterium]MCS7156741.1 S1 family peptidase [Blastocatellia bacterium]MCX7751517.1 S1 family peptidase [Blastocatellia bacterium]MDW8168617.1 hypothetical protein [Acidobacteriota bacterium]